MSAKLEENFTITKIHKVVMDSNGNKSSGPDGISFAFYQTFWELVKDYLYNIVNSFYNQTLNLTKLNHASIVLIPKGSDCTYIEQYRPICLINCSIKIILKILANRITPVIDTLIILRQHSLKEE
jgi:hypothetical protein